MTREANISGFLAAALLAAVTILPSFSLAQKTGPHPPPPRPAPMPQQHVSRPEPVSPPVRSEATVPRQQGHAGDWLRRYKDLPPEEQEKALQNDAAFRKLPPARQQVLRQRLQHFSSLPPQRQLQMLNRMETWEHLTPEQKQQALQIRARMQELPPDRQRMVRTAVRDLRAMPPDQREKVIDSDRFKGMFSDQERDMMRGVTRLPLAPSENEGTPQD